MPTECSAEKFEFGEVSGRVVVAGFDGGAISSDAGALLLGAADRAVRLTERFAACFTDRRSADYIEHDVRTLLLQRVVGIALGYEDRSIMTGCAMIRCSPSSPESSRYGGRTARRWLASPH